MSTFHVNLVNRVELVDIPKSKWPACKNILKAIADHANEAEADTAYPGVELLMLETGYGEATISTTTTLLAKHAWLSKAQQAGKSNLYRLNVAKLEKHQVPKGKPTVTNLREQLPGLAFPGEDVNEVVENSVPSSHRATRRARSSRKRSKTPRDQRPFKYCGVTLQTLWVQSTKSVTPPHRDCDRTTRQPSGTHQPTSAAASDGSASVAADSSGAGWLDDDRAEKDDERDRDSVPSEQPTASTGHDQPADTPGKRLLRDLRAADGSGLNADAVGRHAALVDLLLDAGHTEQQVTGHLTAGIKRAGGLNHKLAKLADGSERLPAAPAERTRDATEQAHTQVNRMANQREQGAREAAGLLGTTWQEPDRGDLGAREYLTEVVPAAAREFVEQHRDHLVTALISPRQVVTA